MVTDNGPISPLLTWWSVWHTPQASTLMRTSPSSTSSIGISLICKGSPAPVTTAALNVCGRDDGLIADMVSELATISVRLGNGLHRRAGRIDAEAEQDEKHATFIFLMVCIGPKGSKP